MAHILQYIYVVFAVVFLFGAAVFVHEFGHFWMARRRGLKVEAFAIGFGPKIFGWTRDGVEYSWNWIPAGGYVKLPQMITSEALEGAQTGSAEKIPPASPWSKILVSFAGPFMNVVFAFVLATMIYFLGLPVTINPPIIGFVEPGSPEATLGIQAGDKITSVDGQKVSSWEEVQNTAILARTNVLKVVINRQGVEKSYDLHTIVSEALGLKVLNLDPRDHAVVADVLSGGAAEAAGLKGGDEIISVAGVPVFGQEHFIKLIQARASEATEVMIKRGTEKMSLQITPRPDGVSKKGIIGAHITSSAAVIYHLQRPGPTPWAQFSDVIGKTFATFGAIAHSKQTGVGAKDLSGPVGIFAMLGAMVSVDYRLALSFLVLLNINLAFINLLPFPVLDGGHILMSIIEKIRRRPINVKFIESITTVFAALLISFMIYVTYNDVRRFSLWKSLFQREMQAEPAAKTSDQPAQTPDKH